MRPESRLRCTRLELKLYMHEISAETGTGVSLGNGIRWLRECMRLHDM